MSAGPLVVTYPLRARSRAIVAEELAGVADVMYLADLAPGDRAAALRSAGALLAHDTSAELRPDEIPLIGNARLLQFNAAGIDWVPTRGLPPECRSPPTRAEGRSRWRSTSSRWRWPPRSACSSSSRT